MTYIFLGGLVLLAVVVAYQGIRSLPSRQQWQIARWGSAALALAVTLLFALMRRFDIAFFSGAAALSIIARGQLGPFSFRRDTLGTDSVSRVRSRFFEMKLDHDSGEIAGHVTSGRFVGYELMDLGEQETRELIEEISVDADSVSLFEAWLDANRAGWREYFEEAYGPASGGRANAPANDSVSEALEVLGLKPGATPDEIRAAHRNLMKGVHPDHGGSGYLASRINDARDLLLSRAEKS